MNVTTHNVQGQQNKSGRHSGY